MSMWIKSLSFASVIASATAAANSGVYQPNPGHDFSRIGQANGRACNGSSVKCAGYLKGSLTDATYNKESLVASLVSLPWEQPSVPTKRPKADDPKETLTGPIFSIQSVPNSRAIALSNRPKGGYILARIIADPIGPEDSRYGIGNKSSAAAGVTSSLFFIVATGYDVSDPTVIEGGRKVATWEIWGIAGMPGKRKLVRVGTKSGNVRYCGPAHPTSYDDRTAKFLKCTTVDALYSLRLNTSLTSRLLGISERELASTLPENPALSLDRLIAAVRRVASGGASLTGATAKELANIQAIANEINDPTNPAWMACGVGCCTADDI